MQLYVYDHRFGGFTRFRVQRSTPLPYTGNAPVHLLDFLGSTITETAWVDSRLLAAYGALAAEFGAPLSVCGGFRRVLTGRRLCASPRCAGLVLDVANDLPAPERERLRRLAVRSGLFDYVMPEHAAPTWVSLQKRTAPNVAPSCPFPQLRAGEENVCVFALQDALAVQGFPPDDGLTGKLGRATERALRTFCRAQGLVYAGKVNAEVWQRL